FSSRRRHTRFSRDWSSDVCSSDLESVEPLEGELASFYVDPDLAVAGANLADLPFPEGSAVTMIVRGRELLAPRGNTVILPGDHEIGRASCRERVKSSEGDVRGKTE